MNTNTQLLLVVTALLLVACNSCQTKTDDTNLILGERINGPANVRDTVNGKVLFTLNEGVQIETTPVQDAWQRMGVWVDPIDTVNDGTIYPGGSIMLDGKQIGKAIDTVTVWLITVDPPSALIAGYTHSNNIAKETVPEDVLAGLINAGKLKKDDMKSFIADFKFEEAENNKELGLTQLDIYESFLVDPSPRDRITLLFNESDDLVGVIHSRTLNTPKYKTYPLVRDHQLTVTARMPQPDINNLIEARNRFLNTVD